MELVVVSELKTHVGNKTFEVKPELGATFGHEGMKIVTKMVAAGAGMVNQGAMVLVGKPSGDQKSLVY